MQTDTCQQMTIHHACQQPTKRAASKLQSLLAADQPTLFLSAGGSSLAVLAELTDFDGWQSVTVTTLDERVTNKADDRNFYQLQQTPVIRKHKSEIEVINPLPDPSIKPTEAGRRFADKLNQWQNTHQSGRIIATVGIGEDGHVAGMIPTEKETFQTRFQSDAVAVGYEDHTLDNEFAKRITTTMTFISDYLDQAIAYAVGESKCPVLAELATTQAKTWNRPAEILKQTPTELFTDCNVSKLGS